MNEEENKKLLNDVLQVGLTVQSIAAVITYALKNNKQDFIKKLNSLLEEFNNSLNDQEKEELTKDIEVTIEARSEEFLKELSNELSEEEMDEAMRFLKESVGAGLPKQEPVEE